MPGTRNAYPADFREQIVALSRAGRSVEDLARLYRTKIEQLQEALDDPDLHQEALQILRGLIDEVRLRPGEEGFTIKLIGDIAQIVPEANAMGI